MSLNWTEIGLKWIIEIESKQRVTVIRYDDSNYLSILIQSIKDGSTAVLVNVKNNLDPELGNRHWRTLLAEWYWFDASATDNLLEKQTFLSKDKEYVQIGCKNVEWSSTFRLYFTTKEENASTNFELTSRVHQLFPLQ